MHVEVRLGGLEQPRHRVLPAALGSASVYHGRSDSRTPEIEFGLEYFRAGRFLC
jgi:hypothetical protein